MTDCLESEDISLSGTIIGMPKGIRSTERASPLEPLEGTIAKSRSVRLAYWTYSYSLIVMVLTLSISIALFIDSDLSSSLESVFFGGMIMLVSSAAGVLTRRLVDLRTRGRRQSTAKGNDKRSRFV